MTTVAIVAMLNQFCYAQLTGPGIADEEACSSTLAHVFYRAIYYQEDR